MEDILIIFGVTDSCGRSILDENFYRGERRILPNFSEFIVDKEFYIEKSEEIICDPTAYQEVDANSDHKLMKIITDFIQKYSGELTEKETKYLADFEFKTSNLYCLSKIHKSKIINEAITTQNTEIITVHAPHDLKMRPIIAGPACPTHRLSHLLDQLLRPLVQYVEANVRDSLDMLSRLRKN